MKICMSALFLLATGLSVTLFLHFTHVTALAAGTIQQTTPANAASLTEQHVMQQISALNDQIRATQLQLDQAKKERQQLQQELDALKQTKPVPPPGNDAAAKAQYQKKLSDWQAKMNSVLAKISEKDAEIKMLEAKLQKLRQQLQSFQGGSRPVRK